jgi:hypothetical protein
MRLMDIKQYGTGPQIIIPDLLYVIGGRQKERYNLKGLDDSEKECEKRKC